MNTFIKVQVSLSELAGILDCKYSGNDDLIIRHIGDIQSVINSGEHIQDSCIYYIESENTLNRLKNAVSDDNISRGIFLCSHTLSNNFKCAMFSDENIRLKFIQLLDFFEKKIDYDINRDNAVHKSAKIGKDVKIAPGVYIGEGAEIGDNCIIHANAVIEPYAKIQDNCVIHSGVKIARHCLIGKSCTIFSNAVIGSDGFGYSDIEGKRYRIAQIGNVEIQNNVDIGACTTIDRATIESTFIGENTKIDNQVQVAHNCNIGKNVFIAGKASLAGSVTVKDRAVLAGGCGIRDHVVIAESSIILAFTGIEEDTEPGQTYFGIPARKAMEMHRINSALTQLPSMLKNIKQIMSKSGKQ